MKEAYYCEGRGNLYCKPRMDYYYYVESHPENINGKIPGFTMRK